MFYAFWFLRVGKLIVMMQLQMLEHFLLQVGKITGMIHPQILIDPLCNIAKNVENSEVDSFRLLVYFVRIGGDMHLVEACAGRE